MPKLHYVLHAPTTQCYATPVLLRKAMNGWVVLILLCGIVWMALPRIGLLAFYRTWRATRERELVEDALKYLLNREHQGRHATPESLSGRWRCHVRGVCA